MESMLQRVDLGEVPYEGTSIGMRIRHGVTSHGFALNIDPEMTAFERFTVCGLHDVTMVSLSQLAAESRISTPADAEVRDAVAAELGV